MAEFNRDYVRTNNWHVEAKISEDSRQWFDVRVSDISAGGLLFYTDRLFKKGDSVWLDIYIHPIMVGGDICLKNVKAVISGVRGTQNNLNAFAVKFTDISSDCKIHLDELVRQTVALYSDKV